MELKDCLPAGKIGELDGDAAVEAARAQQCRVERLGPVRGGKHDDDLVVVKAIHLGQELVQRLLALVVGVDRGVAPLADSIDLIDEDDAGSLLVRFLEEVADLCGTTADEHLDELGAGDLEERDAGLACDSTCEEGLACARRADKQSATGAACTDLVVLLRVLQEVHDLLQGFLCLVLSCDILEGRVDLFAFDLLGRGLAEAASSKAAKARSAREVHRVAHLLAHAAVDEPAQEEHDCKRQDVAQEHIVEQVLVLVRDGCRHVDFVLGEPVHESVIVRECGRRIGLLDTRGVLCLERDLVRAGIQVDLGDLVVIDHLEERAVAYIRHLLVQGGVEVRVQAEDQRDSDDQVQDHRLSLLLVVHRLLLAGA